MELNAFSRSANIGLTVCFFCAVCGCSISWWCSNRHAGRVTQPDPEVFFQFDVHVNKTTVNKRQSPRQISCTWKSFVFYFDVSNSWLCRPPQIGFLFVPKECLNSLVGSVNATITLLSTSLRMVSRCPDYRRWLSILTYLLIFHSKFCHVSVEASLTPTWKLHPSTSKDEIERPLW